jgi:hypothetical protein
MRTRDDRRHTEKVRKQRTVRIILRMAPPEHPPTPRDIGHMAAVHGAACSCHMCGNPRKYFGEETFQERLSREEFDSQVAELDEQVAELDTQVTESETQVVELDSLGAESGMEDQAAPATDVQGSGALAQEAQTVEPAAQNRTIDLMEALHMQGAETLDPPDLAPQSIPEPLEAHQRSVSEPSGPPEPLP